MILNNNNNKSIEWSWDLNLFNIKLWINNQIIR